MHSSYVAPLPETAADDRISFLSVVNFILRNLVLLLAAGLALGLLLALRRAASPVRYTATTSFAIGQDQAPSLLLGLSLSGIGSGRSPQFYTDLVKSPAILEPLVETSFDVAPGKPRQTLIEYYGGRSGSRVAAKEAAMGAVSSRISTKISPVTSVITMGVGAENPTLAAEVAQAILDQIDLFNTRTRKVQTTAERAFSEQRLVEIGAEVRVSEDKLRDFLERNRDISLSPSLTLEKERLSDEVSAKRQLYNTVLQAYERAKMDEVRESPLVTVIGRPTPPLQPDSRGTMRIAVLGFFAGVLLGVLIALWNEYVERIRAQASPEFGEFAALRSTALDRVLRPVRALVGAMRKRRA